MPSQQQHQYKTRTIIKRCSCEPLGVICETDPLMRPPASATTTAQVTTTLVPPPSSTHVNVNMKKCCSCEPGGPLCYLDPMISYDWSSRPKRQNCDLTITERWLEWKVSIYVKFVNKADHLNR